jgi:hypothetical protein
MLIQRILMLKVYRPILLNLDYSLVQAVDVNRTLYFIAYNSVLSM